MAEMTITETNEHIQMLDYRLDCIEKTLAELKGVMLENKLQSRDIGDLQKQSNETLNAINSHDRRLKDLETGMLKLQTMPAKAKAEKWEMVANLVLKAVLGAVVALVLVKIGLQ